MMNVIIISNNVVWCAVQHGQVRVAVVPRGGAGGGAVRGGAAGARLSAASQSRHVRRDARRVDGRRARLLQAEHTWYTTLHFARHHNHQLINVSETVLL
jgi:hypothetical protein